MVDTEKVKEALRICTQSGTITCVDCPYFNDMTCVNSLASDAAEYIVSLEERLSIMHESMEALEKRCNALDALEQRCKALEKRNEPVTPVRDGMFRCGNCNTLMPLTRQKYCHECGQAVKWDG